MKNYLGIISVYGDVPEEGHKKARDTKEQAGNRERDQQESAQATTSEEAREGTGEEFFTF